MSNHRTPYSAESELSHSYPPALKELKHGSSASVPGSDEDPEKKGHHDSQDVRVNAGELGQYGSPAF